tara:strand:- start:3824 stop:4408 length:585 start_codon:yes stop_codon:yes gene_type:complete
MQLSLKAVIVALLSLWLTTFVVVAEQPIEQAVVTEAEVVPEQQPEPEQAEQAAQSEPEPLSRAESEAATERKTDAREKLPFQRQEPPAERSNSAGLSLGKIAISLAAVLLLVVVLGWLFKKLTLRLPGSQHVKVICSVPLGQRERLLVIEIQGKQRVLGVTPHSINMLFELENSLPETKLASDFHTQLQSFLKK